MLKKKVNSRKGAFNIDMLFIMISLFVLVVGFIVTNIVIEKLNDFSADKAEISQFAKDDISDFEQRNAGLSDVAFLLVFVVFVLGLWFSSWIIDTHPIFFVATLILNVVIVIVAMIFQNTYENLFGSGGLSASANEFVIIPFMMTNFVPIILTVAFVTAIILFAKIRSN